MGPLNTLSHQRKSQVALPPRVRSALAGQSLINRARTALMKASRRHGTAARDLQLLLRRNPTSNTLPPQGGGSVPGGNRTR